MKLQFKETKTNTFLVSNEPIKAGKIITAIGQISDYIETVAGHIRGRISSSETHRTPIDECFKIIAQLNPELKDIPPFEIVKQEVDDQEQLISEIIEKLGGFDKDRYRISEEYIIKRKNSKELNEDKRYSKEDIMTWYKHVKTHTCQEAFIHLEKSLSTPLLDGDYCEIETTTIRSRKPDTDINGEDAWIDAVIPKLSPEGKIQVKLK